eukprot:6179661-Karenia_brevis.AAC.1
MATTLAGVPGEDGKPQVGDSSSPADPNTSQGGVLDLQGMATKAKGMATKAKGMATKAGMATKEALEAK